jgi:NifB/MoaA-like Fe-S oxidoreductase
LTGESACDSLSREVLPFLKEAGFRIDILAVKNSFWGPMVTVSGLLVGRDLLRAMKSTGSKYDIAILPPNCLNDDGLFLDDVSLDEFRERASIPVMVGRYSVVDTLKEALS